MQLLRLGIGRGRGAEGKDLLQLLLGNRAACPERNRTHWCQLNVKRLSRRNIEFSGFLLLTALPHPNPPRYIGEGTRFIFSPQYIGGIKGGKTPVG
jgi:hypothetical protein